MTNGPFSMESGLFQHSKCTIHVANGPFRNGTQTIQHGKVSGLFSMVNGLFSMPNGPFSMPNGPFSMPNGPFSIANGPFCMANKTHKKKEKNLASKGPFSCDFLQVRSFSPPTVKTIHKQNCQNNSQAKQFGSVELGSTLCNSTTQH